MYGGMYGFSRAMYRDLASDIVEDPRTLDRCTHHERVLRACEAAVERLMTDRRYFARPARTLFGDIRAYFPMNSQLRVLRVIERHVALVDAFLRSLPQNGLDAMGKPLQCRACTRRGSPCKRMPLPHNGYCPSHQHLAETDVMGPAEAEVVALRRPEPVAA